MVSIQFGLGQPGAPGIGDVGATVTTLKETLPFFISSAGIACVPCTLIGAGFCPGGCVPPFPGLVQVAVAFAVALNVITRSSFPSPAKLPTVCKTKPLSANVGFLLGGFRCTFCA